MPFGPGPHAIAAWRLAPRPERPVGLRLVDRQVLPPSREMRTMGLSRQAAPGPRCWYTTARRSGSVGWVATTGSQARSSTDVGMWLTADSWMTDASRSAVGAGSADGRGRRPTATATALATWSTTALATGRRPRPGPSEAPARMHRRERWPAISASAWVSSRPRSAPARGHSRGPRASPECRRRS